MSKSDTIPSSMGHSIPGLTSDSVAIFSGGLDSTTLVYDMLNKGYVPHLVSFNYGQRHKRELTFAARTGLKLGLQHDIIDLTMLTHLISNSALTSKGKCICNKGANIDGPDRECPDHGEYAFVPEGHYAEDNMKLTVVPNRNMIMLSIAAAIAVNNSYKCIATGVHAGDHFVYPDCRPEFLQAANAAIVRGNLGFGSIPETEGGAEFVLAPYLHNTKEDIAFRALELQVPLHETWSCYKGGETHCGKCGTCVERLEAIDGAMNRWDSNPGTYQGRILDETEYDNDTFWKEAISNANR